MNKISNIAFKTGFTTLCLLLAISFTTISCQSSTNNVSQDTKKEIKYKTPKYIFYFIGDGMSVPQIRMAEAAIQEENFRKAFYEATGESLNREKLNMSHLPAAGMATTNAQNRYITGSAAAATALATGHKTTIGTISMNGDHTAAYPTIAEMAKAKGMKVGILTSVSIDHATPACFYAHTGDRSNMEDISEQLLKTGFDYFAGGSVSHNRFKNTTFEQYKKDAEKAGYSFVNTRKDFDALNSNSGKVIATIKMLETDFSDGSSLPYNIDLDLHNEINDRITLADFVRKGIELLDNDKGFFMMTEGGKIDWTCHANDVVTSVYETVALDNAVTVALDFYAKHPEETLIVVTGDHETGGLTLGYAGTAYESSFDKIANQNVSFLEFAAKVNEWSKSKNMTFEKAMAELQKAFGLGNKEAGLQLSEYETNRLKAAFNASMKTTKTKDNAVREENNLLYGSYDPFTVTATHILNNKAGVDWATYSHTAMPTAVFSIGQGYELFNGYYDNTDIPKKIMKIAKLK